MKQELARRYLAPNWARWGLLESLKGALLGFLIAVTLLTLNYRIFPSLREFDFDVGLRLRAFADEKVRFRSAGMPHSAEESDSYIFLDIDPEPESTFGANVLFGEVRAKQNAPSACEALAQRYPSRFQAGDAARVTQTTHVTRELIELKCSSVRPINRYLLGELVTELRGREPRLIVLDVDLSRWDVVSDAEHDSLHAVLAHQSENVVPILIPRPIRGVWHSPNGSYAQLMEPESGVALQVFSAIAVADPGEPVRRYPKCFAMDTKSSALVPSLPFLINQLKENPGLNLDSVCRHSDLLTPRIVYTLPALRAHQDSAREAKATNQLQEQFLRTWAVYRNVYNRCLAAYFWDRGSLCGRSTTYHDKVVVIGASNHLRRDWHSTPLGNMTGAEIVINAARSFALFPEMRDRHYSEALLDELKGVALGAIIWSFYFFLKSYFLHGSNATHYFRGPRTRAWILTSVFVLVLVVNVCLVVSEALPSFTLLVAVLGVALEQYVHGIDRLLRWFDAVIRRPLGLPKGD